MHACTAESPRSTRSGQQQQHALRTPQNLQNSTRAHRTSRTPQNLTEPHRTPKNPTDPHRTPRNPTEPPEPHPTSGVSLASELACVRVVVVAMVRWVCDYPEELISSLFHSMIRASSKLNSSYSGAIRFHFSDSFFCIKRHARCHATRCACVLKAPPSVSENTQDTIHTTCTVYQVVYSVMLLWT